MFKIVHVYIRSIYDLYKIMRIQQFYQHYTRIDINQIEWIWLISQPILNQFSLYFTHTIF